MRRTQKAGASRSTARARLRRLSKELRARAESAASGTHLLTEAIVNFRVENPAYMSAEICYFLLSQLHRLARATSANFKQSVNDRIQTWHLFLFNFRNRNNHDDSSTEKNSLKSKNLDDNRKETGLN